MLTDAQKAVLTEDERDLYEAPGNHIDPAEYQSVCESLADARIENRAMREMLIEIDHDHCGCLGKGQIIPRLNALPKGE